MATQIARRQRSGEAGGQILEATARLLERTPLAELSVEQICAEAGTSRATYYHYFASKNAAVAALAGTFWDQVFESIKPFVEGGDDQNPQTTIRETFASAWEIWVEHSAVFRALAENWHTDPELEELWSAIIRRFTDAIAGEIDRERAAGTAPPGPDSRQLGAVLLWATAHCLYVAGSGVDDDMPSETAVFETVMSVWLRSVYGTDASQPHEGGTNGK